MEKFSELENIKKYSFGSKDVIDTLFEVGFNVGVSFCFGSVLKYVKRFNSESIKANNESDIQKSIDYLNRCIIASNDYISINKLEDNEFDNDEEDLKRLKLFIETCTVCIEDLKNKDIEFLYDYLLNVLKNNVGYFKEF